MKLTCALASAAALALATGCAIQQPQTAEEFRQMVPGATFGKTETFEVKRPLAQVAETFQKRAPACLSVSVRTTSQTTTSYQVIDTDYKPTVRVTPQRAELHLQQHHRSGVIKVSKEPEGGYYLMVVDAYPATATSTRVQIFSPSIGVAPIVTAVKGWANGDNLGCPDMTKR